MTHQIAGRRSRKVPQLREASGMIRGGQLGRTGERRGSRLLRVE